MNDPEQYSSVQLLWWIQEIISYIEVHSTLHKKWMILNRVLFKYSHEFKKLSYTLRFIAHSIRNEWFSSEFCCTYSHEFKKLSHTLRFIVHYIRNEWFSSEFCCSYSHEFKKLSHTLRFIVHYIRNEWFSSSEFCSSIMINSSKLFHTLRFIAHCIRNEWFWAEFCLTFLMAFWQYSIYMENVGN